MWKNSVNNVNKVCRRGYKWVTIFDLPQHFSTYPQTNQKQKIEYGLLEARNGIYTYSHP